MPGFYTNPDDEDLDDEENLDGDEPDFDDEDVCSQCGEDICPFCLVCHSESGCELAAGLCEDADLYLGDDDEED